MYVIRQLGSPFFITFYGLSGISKMGGVSYGLISQIAMFITKCTAIMNHGSGS